MVLSAGKRRSFDVQLTATGSETGRSEKTLSMHLQLKCRTPLLSVSKQKTSDKENTIGSQKWVPLRLKDSWFNTEKTINKDVCEVIRRVYAYYSTLFEQKFCAIDDFKKMRIFTYKDRLAFLHKR